MKQQIEDADIPPLDDLLEMARLEGVELVACKMTVDMMKLELDDFEEGVVVENAESFLKYATRCRSAVAGPFSRATRCRSHSARKIVRKWSFGLAIRSASL